MRRIQVNLPMVLLLILTFGGSVTLALQCFENDMSVNCTGQHNTAMQCKKVFTKNETTASCGEPDLYHKLGCKTEWIPDNDLEDTHWMKTTTCFCDTDNCNNETLTAPEQVCKTPMRPKAEETCPCPKNDSDKVQPLRCYQYGGLKDCDINVHQCMLEEYHTYSYFGIGQLRRYYSCAPVNTTYPEGCYPTYNFTSTYCYCSRHGCNTMGFKATDYDDCKQPRLPKPEMKPGCECPPTGTDDQDDSQDSATSFMRLGVETTMLALLVMTIMV